MFLLLAILLHIGAYGVGWGVVDGLIARRRSWWESDLEPLLRAVIRQAVGIGVAGYVAFFLLALHLFTPGVGRALAVAMAAVGMVALWRTRRDFVLPGFSFRSYSDGFGAAAFCAASLLLVVCAWTPHLINDAYDYHVAVPKQWLLQGGMVTFPYNLTSNYYLLADMWNTWPLSFDLHGFMAIKSREVLAAIAIGLLLVLEGRRRAGRGAGWIAALLWLLYQETVEVAPAAYIDTTEALLVLLGVLVLARLLESPRRDRTRPTVLAGLLFGLAIGTKITGFVFLGLAGIAWAVTRAWQIQKEGTDRLWPALGRKVVAPGAVIVGTALAVASPWPLRNALVTGNPFFPLAAKVFPVRSEFKAVDQVFLRIHFFDAPPATPSFTEWDFLQQFAANVRYLDYNRIAFSFLLILLAAGLRRNQLALSRLGDGFVYLLIAVVIMIPILFSGRQERFLFGPTAMVLLVSVVIVAKWWESLEWGRSGAGRTVLAGLVVALVAYQGSRALERARESSDRLQRPWKGWMLTSSAVEREYFDTNPLWNFKQAVERETKGKGKVMVTVSSPIESWLDVPILPLGIGNGPPMLSCIAEEGTGRDAGQIEKRLGELGITYVVLEPDGRRRSPPAVEDFVRTRLVTVYSSGGLSLCRLGSSSEAGVPRERSITKPSPS